MPQELSREIQSSQTEMPIRKETQRLLSESQDILDKFKTQFGEESEQFQQAKKEYDEVRQAIIEALKDDRKITQEELALIELEFSNLLKLNGGVLVNFAARSLNEIWKIARWLWADSSQVSFLWDSVKVTNQYQEDLIKKVLWDDYEKWYNDKYLKGHNEQIGNYLISISDFEDYLRNPNTKIIWDNKDPNVVNSVVLANYFLLLESQGKLKPFYIKTVLSKSQLDELQTAWKENPNAIAKKILENHQLFDGKDLMTSFSQYYTVDEKDLIQKPEKIFLVDDKEKLLPLISQIPNIKYEDLNIKLQSDIEIIILISQRDSSFRFNMIPQSFFEIDIAKQDDLEKTKSLFSLVKDQSQFLQLLGRFSVSLKSEEMPLLIEFLWAEKEGSSYEWFFDVLQVYAEKMNGLTQETFLIAVENLKQKMNKADIEIINLYLYKNGIKDIKEELFSLFPHCKDNILQNFPIFHKILYSDIWLTREFIALYPENFQYLSVYLRSHPDIVKSYLDTFIYQPFSYRKVVSALHHIDFWTDISIMLLLYTNLLDIYGREKLKWILMDDKIGYKIQIFFKNLEENELGEAQKKVLVWMSDLLAELLEDFEIVKKSKAGFLEKYENFIDIQERDQQFLQKIYEITWFSKEDNKRIFGLLISNQESANREILWILRKNFKGDTQKVKDILWQLQNIQLQKLQQDAAEIENKLSQFWVNPELIKSLVSQNPKLPNETSQQYQTRILHLFRQESGISLAPEIEKDLRAFIQNHITTSEIKLAQQHIDLYIKYLEDPKVWNNFQEYLTQEQTKIQVNISTPNTYFYPDGTTFEYFQSKNGNYVIATSSWNIELTYKELQIVSQSKEALENLVHFKETIDELWLSKLWNYRENIFQSLKNVYGFVSFDTAWDFINKNELNIFLKSLLKSIWIESHSDNIETTKLQFISENNISAIWWAQKVWVLDRTNIESRFFETFIRKDNKEFRFDLFETTLRK